VVPGSAFLMNPQDLFIRFSCAVEDMTKLALAMDVVETAVQEIVAAAGGTKAMVPTLNAATATETH
jgi:hypothetical protein